MAGISCLVLLAAFVSAQKEGPSGDSAFDNFGAGPRLAHPTNCGAFYSLHYTLERCPTGLHFNRNKQMCDKPKDAGCTCNGGGTTLKYTTPHTSTVEASEFGKDDKGRRSDDICPAMGTCPAVDLPGHPVRLPHKNNCRQFCQCRQGTPRLKHCPPKMHFSARLQDCDSPAKADCACSALPKDGSMHWEPTSCTENTGTIRKLCEVKCEDGFELKGSRELKCTEEGWEGTAGYNVPRCISAELLAGDILDNIHKLLNNRKANVLFILDDSSSLKPDEFNLQLSFIITIIKAFPLSEKRSAGVITFSSDATLQIGVGECNTCTFLEMMKSIKSLGGGTNMREALDLAVKEITHNATHAFTLVVLVTDGESSTNPRGPADIIKSKFGALMTLGVGAYSRQQLEQLASLDSEGTPLFYGIRNFNVFNAIEQHLSKATKEEDETVICK